MRMMKRKFQWLTLSFQNESMGLSLCGYHFWLKKIVQNFSFTDTGCSCCTVDVETPTSKCKYRLQTSNDWCCYLSKKTKRLLLWVTTVDDINGAFVWSVVEASEKAMTFCEGIGLWIKIQLWRWLCFMINGFHHKLQPVKNRWWIGRCVEWFAGHGVSVPEDLKSSRQMTLRLHDSLSKLDDYCPTSLWPRCYRMRMLTKIMHKEELEERVVCLMALTNVASTRKYP